MNGGVRVWRDGLRRLAFDPALVGAGRRVRVMARSPERITAALGPLRFGSDQSLPRTGQLARGRHRLERMQIRRQS